MQIYGHRFKARFQIFHRASSPDSGCAGIQNCQKFLGPDVGPSRSCFFLYSAVRCSILSRKSKSPVYSWFCHQLMLDWWHVRTATCPSVQNGLNSSRSNKPVFGWMSGIRAVQTWGVKLKTRDPYRLLRNYWEEGCLRVLLGELVSLMFCGNSSVNFFQLLMPF